MKQRYELSASNAQTGGKTVYLEDVHAAGASAASGARYEATLRSAITMQCHPDCLLAGKDVVEGVSRFNTPLVTDTSGHFLDMVAHEVLHSARIVTLCDLADQNSTT